VNVETRFVHRFIVGDEAIANLAVHEVARPLQHRSVAVRLVAQQRLDPLEVNVRRSLRAEQIRDGKL
jgi:hypothetical protein